MNRFERDFANEFSDMAEVAKPLNAAELSTAIDLERGHADRINNKPKQEDQSEAYYAGYESQESASWAN